MTTENKPVAIFTVDVDGWPSHLRYYLKNVDNEAAYKNVPLDAGVSKLINLLESQLIKATFFIPGAIAKRYPLIIKMISNNGHEVACHGMSHEIDEFMGGYSEQEESIKTATHILENLTGKKVVGFRAPAFRCDDNTTRVLLDQGYLYNSSSIKTWGLGLYGNIFSSRNVRKTTIKNQKGKGLIEIPIATTPLLPLPLGGSWLRVLTHRFIDPTLEYYKRHNIPALTYIHPRDVSVLPKIKGIPFFTYYKTGLDCLKMLERLIVSGKKKGFRFLTADAYCREIYKKE